MDVLRKITAFSLTVMLMGILCSECRDPVLHRVGGGRYTWAPNINFSEWSSHEHFYMDDWLYFGFDKHLYNVLEVNNTSYENCIDKDFIFNITRGGRDVFHLTEARPYYFISGRGYCFNGMKVAVYVEHPPSSIPSPYLINKGSEPGRQSKIMNLFVLLVTTLAWTCTSEG